MNVSGKIEMMGKYYSSALNLGLPKCPMPVFFVIDVEELLAKVPDKVLLQQREHAEEIDQSV